MAGLEKIIVLENFSNYFNRKIKGFKYIQEYLEYQENNNNSYDNLDGKDFNFVPNDGITTTQIINYDLAQNGWLPDYLLIIGDQVTLQNQSYNLVKSRWYIVECIRTREGQYRLSLRRDVIVEHWNEIYTAPIFVEKANLKPDDPLIFNSEGTNFNQIKKAEYLLKDETNMAWIVGYIARNAEINVNKTIEVATDYTETYLESLGLTIQSFSLPYAFDGNQRLSLSAKIGESSYTVSYYFDYLFQSYYFEIASARYVTGATLTVSSEEELNLICAYIGDELLELGMWHYFKLISNTEAINEHAFTVSNEANQLLRSCDGKILSQGTTKYYTLNSKISENGLREKGSVSDVASSTTIDVCNAINNAVGTYNTDFSASASFTSGSLYYFCRQQLYELWGNKYDPGTITFALTTERQSLRDAPYDMFCIPYCDDGNVIIYNPVSEQNDGAASKAYAIQIAQMIGSYGEGANATIYDLQLLPYCPIDGIVNSNKLQELGTLGEDYALVKLTRVINEETTEENIQIIYFCQASSGTKNINFYRPVEDPKIENECDSWRLCSPNYQGIFEFSNAKNGGINLFNIDWTYKPYTPYIHVNPNFGNLYGQDFNDARGLILGGDFSLAIVSDAWKTYEINNKNYQNMFDREIQSMDYLRKFERIESIAGATAGTGQGAAMGALAGGIPGAVAGGVLSGVGGIADIFIGESKYKESVNYKTDMYNYQLGNIKALPYSLTKSAAQNYNNKLFPFLEYYSCTDREKQALRDKLKYNGMTVMAIGTINDYITYDETWFQGQLIRLDSVAEDSHVIDAIYDELKKGVFINGNTISS